MNTLLGNTNTKFGVIFSAHSLDIVQMVSRYWSKGVDTIVIVAYQM